MRECGRVHAACTPSSLCCRQRLCWIIDNACGGPQEQAACSTQVLSMNAPSRARGWQVASTAAGGRAGGRGAGGGGRTHKLAELRVRAAAEDDLRHLALHCWLVLRAQQVISVAVVFAATGVPAGSRALVGKQRWCNSVSSGGWIRE
jgi:hypothetical protein